MIKLCEFSSFNLPQRLTPHNYNYCHSCQPVPPSGICSSLPSSTGSYFSQHDYHNEESVTELLDNVEISTTNSDNIICRNTELLTDLVCLFAYPPCIAETRTQLGICDESCTTVSTFIKECISFDAHNPPSPTTELFHASAMNLSCSQPYLIPGAQVDQTTCITLTRKHRDNYYR